MLKIYLNKILLCFTLTLFYISLGHSQHSVSFSHLSVKDGLSQNDINAIYQTKNGYMWFGTHDGLNKYDGYNFTHYKPNSQDPYSISSNLIVSITGDGNNNLWIGSTGGGLSYFDNKTEKFTNYLSNKKTKNGIRSNYINSLLLDNKNRLWINTKNGLDMVDCNQPKDSLVFHHILLPKSKNKNKFINVIYQSKSGDIYIGRNHALYRLIEQNNQLKFKKTANDLGNIKGVVEYITEDLKGKLIVSTSKGLFIQAEKGRKLTKFDDLSGDSVIVDNKNNIWVANENQDGLSFFRNFNNNKLPSFRKTFKNSPINTKSISKNIVTALYKDFTGILWIGTNGGGINKFDPKKKPFNHTKKTLSPKSISHDKIRAIFEDSNKTLWFGTEGGGLNYQVEKTEKNKFPPFGKITSSAKKIFALNEFSHHNQKFLLVGSEGYPGLCFINITDPSQQKLQKTTPIPLEKNAVFSITIDHKNNIWIGTYNTGVFLFKYEFGEFKMHKHFIRNDEKNGISNNIIRHIFQDSHKNMWFATGKGLNKLKYSEIEKEHPKFTTYLHNPKDKRSISHDYILSIYETKKGVLWFGTLGGGLNKLVSNPKKNKAHFKTFDETNGLPNNVIKGILEDSADNLWVSSNMGLTKFNPSQKTFKNYNMYDGLQSNEFQELSCYKKQDGQMVFGGINGFNSFYPSMIKDNPYTPQTVITKISLFNKKLKIEEKYNNKVLLKKSINDTSKLKLKYNQNNISLEFAGIQYSSPQKNQYAYKLSGFDKNWNYTKSTRRYATYTNLSPGVYEFYVKSSNGDGVWNDSPRKINIEITPPFWKTIWAYLIYMLLITALLIGLWKFTLINTEKKHDLELQHLEKQKYEELQQMKMQFFTNISHEFRTPLTLIKGPLEYLQNKGSELSPSVINHQYQLMDKNTSYLLRLVTQLLDFQKMDKGQMDLVIYKKNIAEFVIDVSEPFKFISEKKNITYTVRTEDNIINSYFSPDALEKIMNNLLSNAFKFCPDNGTVEVYIYIKKTFHSERLTKKSVYDRVVIEVRDSGGGIPEAKKQRIFNRFYSNSAKELANPTGTGIGLSYTKSLIDVHQGSIAVVNNELGGTTFAVNLPMEKPAYVDKPNIKFGTTTDKVNTTNAYVSLTDNVSILDEQSDEEIISKRSDLPIVLIVDDNDDIRSFIKQSLKDRYNILEAENGAKGYEIAQTEIPNIIISDYVMPKMDGAEFCKNCKQNPEISHIPFILLTAKTSQKNEFEGLQSGADDYITKPFNLELLELKIKNIIGKRDKLRKRFNQEIILKPEDVTVTSTDELFLEKAMEIVEKNMMNTEFSVEMLVKDMSISRSNLYLKLKEITGLSSSEFIRSIRLKRAVQLLETSDLSVKEIMYMTGFNTPSYFAKCFKKQFNMTPSDYVNKNDSKTKK